MRNGFRVIASCVVLLHSASSTACRAPGEGGTSSSPLERFEYAEPHMGGPVRIVLFAEGEPRARAAASAAFATFAALDAAMSDYRADSELTRLSASAGSPPVRVSEDLARVLLAAREFSEISGGAFDVTVGPLVALWREARRTGRLPNDEAIRAARALVGYRRVHVDRAARTVRLDTPGMRLDLGGIGKGYAADRALEALARHGVASALVEAGGDIALGAAPPGRAGWRIDVPGGGVVVAARRGVSTSGDLEQFALIGGVRHSHVVDPRTGLAVQHVATVTVVAADATTSDALASALGVLGPSRAKPLAESLGGVAARFSWRDGDAIAVEETSGFRTEP